MFSGVGNLTTFSSFNFVVWFALAFQAGLINVGGFLACNRYVTHITGSVSRFGIELTTSSLGHILGTLSVPLSFLTGTMISAFFIDRKISTAERPNYSIVFFIISAILLFVVTGGPLGSFGGFGEHLNYHDEYLLLVLLALSAGLQNAAITTASGTVVRTTHLTGLLTDLGIGVVRIFPHFSWQKSRKLPPANSAELNTAKLLPAQRNYEIKALKLRLGLIFSFGTGGTLGGVVFNRWQYLGFLLPFFISVSLFILAQRRRQVGALSND